MVEKEAGARSTFPYEVDSATVNFGPECRSQRASTPTAAPLACIVVNPSKPSATDAVRRKWGAHALAPASLLPGDGAARTPIDEVRRPGQDDASRTQ